MASSSVNSTSPSIELNFSQINDIRNFAEAGKYAEGYRYLRDITA